MMNPFKAFRHFAEEPKMVLEENFAGCIGVCALLVGGIAALATGGSSLAFVAGAVVGAVGTEAVMATGSLAAMIVVGAVDALTGGPRHSVPPSRPATAQRPNSAATFDDLSLEEFNIAKGPNTRSAHNSARARPNDAPKKSA